MGVPHCPHCGVELPAAASEEGASDSAASEASTASFCPSCGRRVEGWKAGYRAALGGAAIGGSLPGSEEPTLAIATSPSLLRAAVAVDAPVEPRPEVGNPAGQSDSELLRTIEQPRSRWLLGGAFLLGGAGLLFGLLALRRPGPPDIQSATPTIAVAPSTTPAPAPARAPGKPGRSRRISAPPITEERHLAGSAGATQGAGGLPHKVVATDRRAQDATSESAGGKRRGGSIAPSAGNAAAGNPAAGNAAAGNPVAGTPVAGAPLPTAVNETLENEASPMSEDERRAEAAVRADADGVRFVVRAHLPQVHACYSRAFKESSPGGRVEIGLVIDQSGKATRIRTESNSTASPGLARCLEQRLAEWEFPRPSAGDFELVYPFVFSPGT